MAKCMEIAQVVQKVLENFSSTELLQLSLVNKLWIYEARSLMRKRGDLTASAKFGYNMLLSCRHLKNLALDVQKMDVVPFRGICVQLRASCFCIDGSCQAEEVELLYGNVFDRVQFRSLSIKFSEGWETRNNCLELGLVKKILSNPYSDLEGLSVLLELKPRELFVQQVLEHSNLGSLKEFKLISCRPFANEDCTNLVKVLVSRAPNLQVLYTECRVNLGGNLLAGSSAVHVTNFGYCAIHGIPDSVAGELRMKRIRLEPINWNFSLERFNRITPMLLRNSRTLLNTVVISPIFLVPLMRYAICLENVQELQVRVDSSMLERSPEQLLRVMRNFDFTRIFPRLVQLEVYSPFVPPNLSMDQMNDMAEQWNFALDEPKLDRAVNIKSIIFLRPCPLDDIPFRFLAQMVPHVEKISALSDDLQNIPFSLFWQQFWLDLKDIEVRIMEDTSLVNYANLDDVLCGIDPEEVDVLRQQDDDYLREVHIVPGPSISYLKSLRTFKLIFDEPDTFEGPLDDPTFLFSKVTDLLTFKRCPNLTVTLELNNLRVGRDLRHLAPYVHVVSYHGSRHLKQRLMLAGSV